MKSLLVSIVLAVVLVGCGTTQLPLHSAAAKSENTGASAAQPTRDTRQTNPQAGPALVDAARAGNLEAAKQHLAAGADVDFRNQEGLTALHMAAVKGHNKVAELLIAKGANVNTSGRLIGTTPLDSAALLGHKEMVELLIDSGADINPQIITGETPLQRAEQRGHSAIVEILRKHGGKAGEVTLQLAILKGQKDVAKSLITGGADVNAKGLLGRTPLDWAIIGGKNELANLLRKHGAKTGEELKSAELVSEAAETSDIEVIKQILAFTEGKWILKAIGKEQGQEFNDAGTVINKWNESKSELLMESKINRGERIIELVDIIKIDKGRVLMDRGWHQLIGKWNSNEKTIVWNNKSGDFVFTGSSDFSEKQNIKQVFSIYRDGTQVFSVTAELKAEGK